MWNRLGPGSYAARRGLGRWREKTLAAGREQLLKVKSSSLFNRNRRMRRKAVGVGSDYLHLFWHRQRFFLSCALTKLCQIPVLRNDEKLRSVSLTFVVSLREREWFSFLMSWGFYIWKINSLCLLIQYFIVWNLKKKENITSTKDKQWMIFFFIYKLLST